MTGCPDMTYRATDVCSEDGCHGLEHTPARDGMVAATILLEGVVQGVGFRPFIHRHAGHHHLCGFVQNTSDGVVVEVEGCREDVERFYARIPAAAPPLSRITRSRIEFHAPRGWTGFEVKKSDASREKLALISPDVGICPDCLREMRDPRDRRHRYPFTNCTNCGPRFTIMESIPYDRGNTSMKRFIMCPSCQAEYTDISDRRYHAQPNACPVCGPQTALAWQGQERTAEAAIREAVSRLSRGEIVAVKGLGGYHLACDATNEAAVSALRGRKRREEGKPFAVMIRDLEAVRRFCHVDEDEKSLLESRERPILLLRKRADGPVAQSVAPHNHFLGVMLPYTPLHYLLMDKAPLSLVMTSGNSSEEPLVADDDEAQRQLRPLADAMLSHDRPIVNRCDDSVIAVMGGAPVPIRRSRGYAPLPVILSRETRPTLAVGPELKNTFAVSKKNLVFLSQHIGDLKNEETYAYFREAIERLKGFFEIEPEIVAYDLHPQYLSTRYALGCQAPIKIAVQHHHAHISSCMAENNLEGEVIGVALDGTGYGTDGTIWGGEFLLSSYRDFVRAGYLNPVPMPGGDKAAREPYRMAVSYLNASLGAGFFQEYEPWAGRWEAENVDLLRKMIELGVNAPLTSSAGRLFDAVSSIIGICDRSTYDAQASIELEMAADETERGRYPYHISEEGTSLVIDPGETIRSIVADVKKGLSAGTIAARFHLTFVGIIVDMCRRLGRSSGLDRVALSGGVFQNRFLVERVIPALQGAGFTVYFHSTVPPNDGGIALGQVAVANEVARSCA